MEFDEEEIKQYMMKGELQMIDISLELLKNAYKSKLITEPMLRLALDRNEISLREYVKIINQ